MKRLLAIALLAFVLSGCETIVVPGMYGPHRTHTLQCLGGETGECRLGKEGSFGGL